MSWPNIRSKEQSIFFQIQTLKFEHGPTQLLAAEMLGEFLVMDQVPKIGILGPKIELLP